MKFDPQKHHRHSIRLKGYDYSLAGAYYVTIVAHGREHLFGEIVGADLSGRKNIAANHNEGQIEIPRQSERPALTTAEMQLNRFGQIVQYAWYDLPKHYPHVELDTFCIMPNHVHAIIVLTDAVVVKRHPLSEIVRAFKSFSARRINSLRNTQGIPVWQRNYYEHIIRNQQDYLSKSGYILDNPRNWEEDDENIK